MKLWNRFVIAGLVLVLAFSFGLSPAAAASKKKKKEEKKKEEKRSETRHETRHYGSKKVIDGGNIAGRPGYIFGDTANTLEKGQVMGAAHLTFDSWGSVVQIPVGVTYGVTDKLQINANTSFWAANGISGIYFLNFGGKYGFTTKTEGLGIAAGLDFAIGPLSNTIYGYSTFGFDPYGVVTYTLPDGLQLNGKLGLYVQTYNYTFGPYTFSGSYSFFQCDLGAAYPFDANLTGIAELATNGVVQGGGLGGTPLIVGIRTGHDVQFQAFGGFDFGGATGLLLGGGVVLMSK